nr:AAA family ATPase [Bifidobacterium pullorum]
MVKLVTGIRRCWKTYLLFNLFDDYLCSKIANGREQYYIFFDKARYAISREELKTPDTPPRLYGVLNGLLRMRNVDVYVTGSNPKFLSRDVMTEFRGRGTRSACGHCPSLSSCRRSTAIATKAGPSTRCTVACRLRSRCARTSKRRATSNGSSRRRI